MDKLYIIFILTFLGFPIISILLYNRIQLNLNSRIADCCVVFFALHNLFFILGFSLKGEIADYAIFSLEYLAICLVVFATPRAKNVKEKLFNIVGIIAILIGTIMGIFGFFLFGILLGDLKADKIFLFESSNKVYETRRYSDGFVTAANTIYTFKTYKQYRYLPFEKKIDETIFSDAKIDLNITGLDLQISVVTPDNKNLLEFKSTNGKKILKVLE